MRESAAFDRERCNIRQSLLLRPEYNCFSLAEAFCASCKTVLGALDDRLHRLQLFWPRTMIERGFYNCFRVAR